MERHTYRLFIKALYEQQTLAENKARRTGEPIPAKDDIFPRSETQWLGVATLSRGVSI